MSMFISKYPFSHESRRFIKKMKYTPSLIAKKHFHVLKKVKKRLIDVIKKKALSQFDDENEVLVYSMTNYVVAIINDDRLKHSYIECLEKAFSKNLMKESLKNILKLSLWTFGISISPLEERIGRYEFNMNVFDYMNLTSRLVNPHFKLVNRIVSNGLVEITMMDLKTLLAEALKKLMYSRLDELTNRVMKFKSVEPEIESIVMSIKKELEIIGSRASEIMVMVKKMGREAYPPCMNDLINRLNSGVNLEHEERLVLLFFMINVNVPNDDIVKMFETSPDFSERMTVYFVKQARKKKYKSYGCRKIESYGLCKRELDRWCKEREVRGLKSPITYFNRKSWYLSKRMSEKTRRDHDFDFNDDYEG